MSIDTIEKPPVEQPTQLPAEKKPETAEKLVIFAWSGELDKIWPTLILATTGAAMGKETTVFFTFWGLFPIGQEPGPDHGRELDAEDALDDEPRW